jgi:hypothetical protein
MHGVRTTQRLGLSVEPAARDRNCQNFPSIYNNINRQVGLDIGTTWKQVLARNSLLACYMCMHLTDLHKMWWTIVLVWTEVVVALFNALLHSSIDTGNTTITVDQENRRPAQNSNHLSLTKRHLQLSICLDITSLFSTGSKTSTNHSSVRSCKSNYVVG